MAGKTPEVDTDVVVDGQLQGMRPLPKADENTYWENVFSEIGSVRMLLGAIVIAGVTQAVVHDFPNVGANIDALNPTSTAEQKR